MSDVLINKLTSLKQQLIHCIQEIDNLKQNNLISLDERSAQIKIIKAKINEIGIEIDKIKSEINLSGPNHDLN